MGMDMRVSTTNTTKIELRNRDGSAAGTLTISQPRKSTKKKKLSYNFKKISNRIMSTKSSGVANRVVREARSELVSLLMKQRSAKYDSQEVKSAIEHARSMERVAKKKRKHMEEEERAKQNGSTLLEDELETSETEETKESQEQQDQEQAELSSEELEQLAREIEQLMKESRQEMAELAEELVSSSWENMDEDDLDNLRRKHRAEELKDIVEADMKYLKALFDKLAKEQRANASDTASIASEAYDTANPDCGVSLEIAGVEMPVEVSDVPVTVEGACVDVSL